MGLLHSQTGRLLFVLLVGLLVPTLANAQEQATLRGLVTSADDGRALQGANVLLTGIESDFRQPTATNVDGYYEMPDVPPGRYRLQVSFVGFETYRDTLSLSGGIRNYGVTLISEPQQLGEVRVEVERGAAHRQAGLQTAQTEDLERVPTPGPSGDLSSYLQTLPGVVSGGDRGGGFNIRGGTTGQNLFYVDDIPLIKPIHISNLYSAFPGEALKSVDVYAGGFGAEYLGRASSVIDVSLREGNMQEYSAGVSISPYISSLRVEGPIEKGRQSFLAVLRRSTVEETSGPLYGRDVPLHFYDFTGRYSIQEESLTCSVTGVRTHDRGRLSNARDLQLSWSNTGIGGRCLLFGRGLDHALEVSGGYTSFRNAVGSSEQDARSAGLKKGYLKLEGERESPWGTLQLGARPEFAYYEYSIDAKFASFGESSLFGGNLQMFASLQTEVGDNLTLNPSVGVQLAGRTSPATLEPRFRASYRPTGTDRSEVNLAIGKYNQIAEGITDTRDAGTEFTVWTPESGGAPQQSLHAILGYRHRFAESFEVSVEGYAKSLSNITVPEWNPLARFETDFASANGTAYGADLQIEATPDPFYVLVGYGWSKVKYKAGKEDLGAWIDGTIFEYSPSHDRRHQANVVAGVEIGQTSADLRWEFGSGRPYTRAYGFDLAVDITSHLKRPTEQAGQPLILYNQPYGGRLVPYHRLDVSIEHSVELSSRAALNAEVGAINLYNRSNIFYYDISRDNVVNQIPIFPYLSIGLEM